MVHNVTPARNTTIIKVLVASPSDVSQERKIAAEEIEKWNIVNRNVHQIQLEAVLWETHAHLDSGNRPQELLNLQIVDGCDFVVAMFHARIGTDTGLAPGGAVEEVRRMMEQGKPVMCWFSGMPLPNDVDTKQLDAVREFRSGMLQKAFCDTYSDHNDFRQKVAHQLSLAVNDWYGAVPLGTVTHTQTSNEACACLTEYQTFLKSDLGNLNLSGSSAIANFAVPLSDTFVSLRLSDTPQSDTRLHCELSGASVPEGTRVRSPEEVMALVFRNHHLLLVIGDPGSGKTTLMKYYALSCLDGRHDAFGFTSPVPVFWLPLRELKRTESGYGSLAANLARWCARNSLEEITPEHCAEWLKAPQVLVLFDGLDEISEVRDRIELCQWIDLMVKRYQNARFVVTSRSTGYRKGDGIEIEMPHVRADIMDFNENQQSEFLGRWFRAAYRRELPPKGEDESHWQKTQDRKADEKAAAITAFLAEGQNRSIRTLAAVPLLLQIMALLWKEHDSLPENRMKLYDAALDYLLDYRDRHKKLKPLLSTGDARRVLAPVSLWMQETVMSDEAKRDEVHTRMETVLCTLNTTVSATAFCRNLVERAGVLVEYGDADYVFRHKTFREYLAAVQLEKNIRRTSGFLEVLVPHFGDDWWSEVFRFFIAHLDDEHLFEQFMLTLFDSPVTETLSPKQQELLLTLVREAPQKQYGELIRKLQNPETTPNRQRYLVECLNVIGRDDALEAVRKFEMRGERGLFINTLELDAHYIPIKGGTFTYSVTGNKVMLRDFQMARYQVTNRQYRRFIDYLTTGKLDDRKVMPLQQFRESLAVFAKKAELNWLVEKTQGDHQLAGEFRSAYDDDKRFNGPEHPVVAVTWYAARSYCLWLSLVESEGERIDLYRLPDENEWEYAAAGHEGRNYPWGSAEPTPKHANYNRNEGATTPVGSYPEGATPEGLYDMAGNVWEWQENHYDNKKYPGARALRGGSWYYGSELLCCSARFDLNPEYWDLNIGFRVLRPSPHPETLII
jgi:formylglycine-generating enzyme required for sulfatase activity